MKFKPTELRELLSSSYHKQKFDIGKFKIDGDLSDERIKVYVVENTNDVVVVHRGSQDINDWIDNLAYLELNILKNTKTYKIHLKLHMKVVKKYGAENIIVLGHSRGGLYATELYKDNLASQLITYNKPLNKHDVIDGVINNDDDDNVVDIRTSGDITSSGKIITQKNKNDVVIPSTTYNPLTEHSTKALSRLDDNELIGSGIFKPKIDYTKIRKNELKKFIKTNKKRFGVNITGLTKKQMIQIIEAV